MEEVSRAWTAINDWLARFAPASADEQYPPAGTDAIAAASWTPAFTLLICALVPDTGGLAGIPKMTGSISSGRN